jgi:uncharacterized metal-binding protein
VFLRGDYDLPSWGTVLVVMAIGIALILLDAMLLGVVLIAAFIAISLYQLAMSRRG